MFMNFINFYAAFKEITAANSSIDDPNKTLSSDIEEEEGDGRLRIVMKKKNVGDKLNSFCTQVGLLYRGNREIT